ncbi:Monofunctional biosynthetic peptidoglycan transglycosylase [Curvibacter sp. AEP1-3]|uniref:biosynthetic peptidoglycan transglycosylase n=1 Tax=Curvibacter sp. AEP1-3 TaxID=1844971 RepID=UPI000B3BEB10|nr:biosynthetic peptidoglycan transglycosylase [Curvibacter sp. AEP1-3]ARV19459.1 Monofunctional biosynthetic peptidoglycan transglycosylase [Curvibacter sp. AEP1-3]
MRTLFRALRITAIAALILMLALFAMLMGARAVLRPAPGDWSTTVHAGPIKLEVGVAALIQWGTTPWIAQQLHGRTLPTRMGDVHVTWDATRHELALHCKPCVVRSSSWGTEPVRLADARMTVQRNATELKGTLSSGAVNALWHGTLRPKGLNLHITLPETPVRDAYALFAAAIPELAYAQIDGTVAVQATLELPAKKLTVQPRLQAMTVSGLGTETWGLAQSTCGRGLPASHLGADSLLARAVIAAEDQRFYEHSGYDLAEMTQALHSNQAEDATLRGASTLSQQVAKLLVTGGERSPVRKLRELLYAVEMEQTLGKARILRLYLDHAPWGATVCGAQAAAHTYFGKRADQLTAAQAVWLAAMLHNPALEAQRWKARGSINLERAKWVAAGLRPLHRAKRARLLNELTAMGPVNSGISGSTTLSKQ